MDSKDRAGGWGHMSARETGSSVDVPLLPLFSNAKDLKVLLFCREEASGEEEDKNIGNRREV